MTGYGDAWIGIYDSLYHDRDDPDQVVAFVRRWANPATVLELGVGTGRLALPLAAAGFDVTGVDNSIGMLDRLRAKPGAERIAIHVGDIIDPPVSRRYGCVLIAFSTLFLLPDQTAQRRCLQAAAHRLEPSGALVVEGFVPEPSRWRDGYSLTVDRWGPDLASFTVGRIDPTNQIIETLRVSYPLDTGGILPNRLRYVLPAELDDFAATAGLRRAGAFANFAGESFQTRKSDYVLVYRPTLTDS